MDNTFALSLIIMLGSFASGWWIGSGIALRWIWRPPSTVAQFHELRPFYLPLCTFIFVASAARDRDLFDVGNLVFLGLRLLAWFYLKDVGGDDDRWKRRRAKLAAKVARLGARLVVSPAGAP